MRDYGKISTLIWDSKKFKSLRKDEFRYFYLYLHTCTHVNSIGCFKLKIEYIMGDLKWDEKASDRAIKELCIAGLIEWDSEESLILITQFLEKSPTTNPKHAIGSARIALNLPESPLKHKTIENLKGDKFASELPDIKDYDSPIDTTLPLPTTEPLPEPDSSIISDDINKKSKSKRGTRISENWLADENDINHATKKGYNNDQINELGNGFRDHWIAATGKGATALDWNAKWRTWISNDIKWHGSPSTRNSTANISPHESLHAGAALAVSMLDGTHQDD